MTSLKLVGGIRVLVAVALLYAVVWQITDRLAHNLFRPAEYFSYFSIQGTLICAVVLAVSGVRAIKSMSETKLLTLTRLSTTVYVVVISVVYNALLRGGAGDIRDAGYNWPTVPNEIIHVWGPVLMLLDWLLIAGFTSVRLRASFWVVVYPIAWLAFSVTRGNIDGWWAYWFLDPTDKGGMPQMLTYIFGICVLMIALGFILALITKALKRIQIR
ncbi:MAG: Pr6Pr family membrane protein [Micrococcales bacterium]